MADKELLELAAKAAGMTMRWAGPSLGMVTPIDPTRPNDCGSIGPSWNPLTDDGDSRRLEVKLKMQVHVDGYRSAARVGEGIWSACEHHIYGGPENATRRAVALAAAAIWQSQQGNK